jgi:prepilin-type N-terminal cleavage/methylation domain-containing protein
MPAPLFARRKAFSITELLVVVAVILILSALVIIGANTFYTQAMQVKCQHNLEQIGHACLMYASKNYGQFPKAWDMQNQRRWYEILLDGGYVDSPAAIGCPLEPEPTTRDVETPASLTDPIERGLDWLERNQQANGSWDPNKYLWGYTSNAITAMALMSFLGFGCTDTFPEDYKDNVRKAMDYLIGQQNKTTGRWDDTHYRTSVCTMAMAWAAMVTGDSQARAAAEKGLTAILNNLTTAGAWTYNFPTWHGDVSVTSWALQAVDVCIKAGIPVPQEKRDLMEEGLKNMVFPDNSYLTPYRFKVGVGDFASEYTESNNLRKPSRHMAMSMACRLLRGHRPATVKDPVTPGGLFRGQLDWFYALESGEPRYRRYATYNNNENFLYYYYYMTIAMSLLGGQNWSDWAEGSSPIFPNQLTRHQRRGTTGDGGSWYEVLNSDGTVRSTTYGLCSVVGLKGQGTSTTTAVGRAYSTALALMTLEAGMPGRWTVGGLIAGKCSYGYNVHVGKDRCSLKADTIVVIDYDHWVVSRGIKALDGTFDPVRNDPPHYVAPRHGGRANILFGNGRVESLRPEDILDRMWTLDAKD